MPTITDGAIDCDIHPGVPDIKRLLRYMEPFWQESFVARGLDGFDMMSYPLNAPITCRPDWRVKGQRPGSSLTDMQRDALDRFGIGMAICNPLTGGQVVGQREHGRGDLFRRERLDHRGMAGQGLAPARLDRGAGPGAAIWRSRRSNAAPATIASCRS